MKTIWTLVVDATRASVFEGSPLGRWKMIKTFQNEDGNKSSEELRRDRPGRVFQSQGTKRHAVSESISKEDQVQIDFAKELSDHLTHARAKNTYDRLILVADPVMLGFIRDALDDPTQKTVVDSLSMNIQETDPEKIRQMVQNKVDLGKE